MQMVSSTLAAGVMSHWQIVTNRTCKQFGTVKGTENLEKRHYKSIEEEHL
jgi:hypothetical protein